MADIHTAWQAFVSGDVEQAQLIATHLAKTDPDDAAAWYVLSQTLDGERAELFEQKARSLDPNIAASFAFPAAEDEIFETLAGDEPLSFEGSEIPTTFLDEEDEEPDFLDTLVDDEPLDEETPTEYFAVPDVRPKVESLEDIPPVSTATAADPKPVTKRQPAGNLLNTVALFVVGILILLVLYLLINTLL